MSGKKSFLYRLLTYAPGGRTAWEDFFTEAFIAVLEADPSQLAGLLQHLAQRGRLVPRWDLEPADYISFTTQYKLPRGRPDIAILVEGEPRIFIESKMGAAFTERAEEGEGESVSQIDRYVQDARAVAPDAVVALASLAPRMVDIEDEQYVGNFYWSDVYDYLKGVIPIAEVGRAQFMKDELLELMEDLDMPSPSPLRIGDSEHYREYQRVLFTMRRMVAEGIPGLLESYVLEAPSTRPGSWYAWQDLVAPGFRLGVGLLIAARDDHELRIWPCVYVFGGEEHAPRAVELLEAAETVAGWPGKCTYPKTAMLKQFHSAAGWPEQVMILTDYWRGCLDKLVDGGLVEGR